MFDHYLRELERELSRRLPEEDVRTRLVEVEGHLYEATEAYGELGLDPAEVVRTMGCPRRLAEAFARTATERPHRWRLASFAGALLAFAALNGVCAYLDSALLTNAMAVLAALGLGGAALGAMRARRPALLPLVAMAVALVLPMALGRALMCLELPIPGTARPARGLSTARLIYRPYGPDRNLLGFTTLEGKRVLVSDLLPNVDPLPVRLAHNVLRSAEFATSAFILVGAVDLTCAGLGLAVLSRRRRRSVA